MERCVKDLAGLLVGANDIDMVADRFHALMEDEDFILLGEIADEHQDFLAGHALPPMKPARISERP
jgi:hypothetical protein